MIHDVLKKNNSLLRNKQIKYSHNKKMKILLLLNQPYPNGYALTKRFHLYAKGFIKNGHSAKLIIPIPREKIGQSNNTLSKGSHEGVPFEYSWRNCERSNNFIIRRFHDLYGALKTGLIIINEKPNIIIISSFSLFIYCYIKLISLFMSFKLIREKCEVDHLNQDSINQFEKIQIKIINSFFDGFIVITRQLEEYQKQILESKSPYIKVPILVEDFRRGSLFQTQKKIVYTGTFLERKDGIITILKAFSKFRIYYPDYKLVLTGSPVRSPDYQKIIDTINDEKLNSYVVFTGYLQEKELQNTICTAELHILTKPENRQNHYNFPTKIGEYMITGRPILATNVGVIGELLTNEVNVFFTEYSSDAIAEKMIYIIKNKHFATQIGNNGRLYALCNFDYEYHTDKMIEFFNKLILTKSANIYNRPSIEIINNKTSY